MRMICGVVGDIVAMVWVSLVFQSIPCEGGLGVFGVFWGEFLVCSVFFGEFFFP